MTIDYEQLVKWQLPEIEHHYTRRDTMLYALGVGLGANPSNFHELRYVYEDGLQALPTMATILCYPGPWYADPRTGLTRSHVVHGEQGFVVHSAMPAEGTVVGKTEVIDVFDKGKDRGALVLTRCTVRDKDTNAPICSVTSTAFCRADGGFGGPPAPRKSPHATPQTPPDVACDLATLPQAALIYRLSGDYNPLHVDPNYARKAGFEKPILHGRCTFGVVGHALLKTCCAYDAMRLISMEGRFSSPVYPGETVRTEMWVNECVISFRATVPARGVTVLDSGRAELAPRSIMAQKNLTRMSSQHTSA